MRNIGMPHVTVFHIQLPIGSTKCLFLVHWLINSATCLISHTFAHACWQNGQLIFLQAECDCISLMATDHSSSSIFDAACKKNRFFWIIAHRVIWCSHLLYPWSLCGDCLPRRSYRNLQLIWLTCASPFTRQTILSIRICYNSAFSRVQAKLDQSQLRKALLLTPFYVIFLSIWALFYLTCYSCWYCPCFCSTFCHKWI